MLDQTIDILDIPTDMSWLRASFLVPETDFNAAIVAAKNYTNADNKFQNTSLGGNYAVNIPPQFTHIADPLIRGVGAAPIVSTEGIGISDSAEETGMGRYFSESIDDNKQLVHMRFGVAEYNSLARFFINAYDYNQAKVARTGEVTQSMAERVGAMVGKLTGFITAIPLVAITCGVRLLNFGLKLLGWGAKIPSIKFYYIKPTMRLYWKAVNYMATTLAVNMGIMPGYDWDGRYSGEPNTNNFSFISGTNKNQLSAEEIRKMHDILPTIFREDGGIDVREVANRAKALEIRRRDRLVELLEQYNAGDPKYELLGRFKSLLPENIPPDAKHIQAPTVWFDEYMKSKLAETSDPNPLSQTDEQSLAQQQVDESTRSIYEKVISEATSTVGGWLNDNKGGWFEEAWEYARAEMLSGSDWVTFRVTGDKTVSESFSNETGESSLSEKINSTSGAIKDAKFNFAQGDIGIPVLQQVVDFVGSMGKEAVATFADWAGLDGLGALLGGGYIDIPHTWKDSSANLPKIDYTLELRATYGNKISIYTDVYIPLIMILAGTLPLSTGRNSYTSPFLVEIYRKGRSQVRLGIIESVNITRGTGNAGWSVDELPLGVDVSFSITDLSQIIHLPLDDTFGAYDDSSAYGDYMASLGSLGLSDMTMWPKINARAKAKFRYDWHTLLFNNRSGMINATANFSIPFMGTSLSLQNLITTFSYWGGGDATSAIESRG